MKKLVNTTIIDSIVKYCEEKQIYDKLSNYGDFYYKLKHIASTDWIITDPDVGQRCKILSDSEFLFEEGDREEAINLKDYTLEQMVVACEGYGYDSAQVFEWLVGGVDDKMLIAECIFEMDM